MHTLWTDALEKAKANRTVFAQRRIRPDEALPEWQKQQFALGSSADVQRFVQSACARLNARFEPARRPSGNTPGNTLHRLPTQHLPEALRLRLADEGLVPDSRKPRNLPREAMSREVAQALDFLQAHPRRLEALANERAQTLLADHRRVCEAARDVGQYSVAPCLPVDVIGVTCCCPTPYDENDP